LDVLPAALRRLFKPTVAWVLVDLVALVLAFVVSVWLRHGPGLEAALAELGLLTPGAMVFVLGVMAGLLAMGKYRARQRPTRKEIVVRVLFGVALGGLADILFFYLVPDLALGRGLLFLALAMASVLLVVARLVMLRLIDENQIKRRVLIIGTGAMADRLRLRLRRRADRRRFDIVGFVSTSSREDRAPVALSHGGVISLDEARSIKNVDEIVVALDDRRAQVPLDFLLYHKRKGTIVSEIVDFLERETERLDIDILAPSLLLYEASSQTGIAYRWFKRFLDFISSAAFLIFCAPVFAAMVVCIWMEDGFGAPIFYRQKRVGMHGNSFDLLKFRSMTVDAESASGPRFASPNDSRVTRVGRFMRRFRIDELPQLVNVLRGEMSIVGPRPERPEFVEQLMQCTPLYFYRHGVRPGLAGWAQLNYPYGASIEDGRQKLAYDLYYIKNTNLIMDFLILMQTLEVVIWGRGTSMAGVRTGARASDSSDGAGEEPTIGHPGDT
jgi:sugar transferase (PEP-CTERM system associated)